MHMCAEECCTDREQLAGVSSLFLPCGSWDSTQVYAFISVCSNMCA